MSSEADDATPVQSSPHQDITQEFFDLCSELKEGENVFMPGHDYSTAIQALELMQPKVDVGMERYVPPVTLQSLIAEKYFDTIDDKEVLAIIDATLSCYVSWINGNDISNSLYTNILLGDPDDIAIPHLVLDTLAKIFQHVVPLTMALIRTAGIAADEDFVFTEPFDRPTKCDWNAVMKQIEAIDELFRGPKDKPKVIEPIKRSICLRLQWLRLFVEIWYLCLPPLMEDAGVLYAYSGFQSDFSICQAVATAMRRTAFLMRDDKVNGLMKLDEEGKELDYEHDGDYSWLRVFDPKYLKNFACEGFPRRAPSIRNRKQTQDILSTFSEKFFNFILHMCQTATSVENIFGMLSTVENNETSLIQRAFLQVLLQPIHGLIFGKIEIPFLIKKSIIRETKNIAFKENSRISSEIQCRERIYDLICALTDPIQQLFTIMGTNTARRREELEKVIKAIADAWPQADALETFIEEFDHGRDDMNFLMISKPVHAWLSSFAVQLTKYYFELSFELKMYHHSEYEIMFRAYAVLLQNRCESIGALLDGTEEILDKEERAAMKDYAKIKELNTILEPARQMYHDLRLRKEFALAVFLACSAMRRNGHIAPTYWDEQSRRLTIEHRLQLVRNVPYLKIDYDRCVLTMWERNGDSMDPQRVWIRAKSHFINAQTSLANLGVMAHRDVYKSITTIIKKNIVVCNLAQAAPERRFRWNDENHLFPLLELIRD